MTLIDLLYVSFKKNRCDRKYQGSLIKFTKWLIIKLHEDRWRNLWQHWLLSTIDPTQEDSMITFPVVTVVPKLEKEASRRYLLIW